MNSRKQYYKTETGLLKKSTRNISDAFSLFTKKSQCTVTTSSFRLNAETDNFRLSLFKQQILNNCLAKQINK